MSMSSRPCFHLKLTVIALTLLYSGLSKANNTSENTFFPLHPRLNVTGGTGDNTYGAADIMAPLFGSTNAIIYTDIDGQTGKSKVGSDFLSLGLGVRDAINNDLMLGGYAFIDRSETDNKSGDNHWTVLNPGVEFMTNHWDGRINGYIPTSSKENIRGPYFGTQVNRPDAVSFSRHDQYSYLFNKVNEIGPGIDADVGYTFTSLRHLRVHGGGYYFNLSDTGDINGGEAGIEMPINHYLTLQFDDSYDNIQQNTGVVSLRFTLGGINKSCATPTVQDRMLDPIYRHLGALATNTGIPDNHALVQLSGPPVLQQSNIWFFNANNGATFDPSAGLNNCTYEHPCKGPDFNQNNINIINSIDSNANFYFTPGTYTIAPETSMLPSNSIDLNSGQSMYGRTSDYTMPASSTSGFPTFVGEIDLQGNNTLDSFRLINNNGSQTIGIHISSANNILINNLQIGNINNAQQSYANSIQLDNSNNITIQNSTIQSTSTNPANTTTGIQSTNSTLNANNNTFNLSGGLNVYGIGNTSGNINSTDNKFYLSTSANDSVIIGLTNAGTGNINSTHDQFTLTNNGTNGSIFGIYNKGNAVVVNNNQFTFNSAGIITGNLGLGVSGNNNTFNFNGNNPSNTCGTPISGTGNTYNGIIC